jgi:murein L,D-transpeptidase YcbB/YkuD
MGRFCHLDQQNMSVLNLSGERLDPYQIDWWNPGRHQARPGMDGELVFRPDVYQHDASLLRALDRPLALSK